MSTQVYEIVDQNGILKTFSGLGGPKHRLKKLCLEDISRMNFYNLPPPLGDKKSTIILNKI